MHGQPSLEELDLRLKTILPEEYKNSYEAIEPVPMRSAGLKYGDDGLVAWDKIWGSFCDLAMAGGPPHKGALLEPGTPTDVDGEPERYRAVTDEICRGITLATDLPADVSPVAGWVRVDCYSETMAEWLLRAIVMENIAVRADRRALDLPAAPRFRLEKEIKNVVTVIAKTSHYYLGHTPNAQKRAMANLFMRLGVETPLIEPAYAPAGKRSEADVPLYEALGERLSRETGLAVSPHQYAGWLGLECASVSPAVWMMRALVASNVLSRREDTVLFVPVNPVTDPGGERVARALSHVRALATSTSSVASTRTGR